MSSLSRRSSARSRLTVVTGGAGFIGQHLVRLLQDRGERVRVVEKPGVACEHLPKTEVVFADIRDRFAVRRAVAGATHVYHLAANPQLWAARRGEFHQVNYLGTVNVLDEALAAGAERIVHGSTESILTRAEQTTAIAEDQVVHLRDVIGPYCRSKYRAEQYALRFAHAGFPIVIVNPTLPIGPGDWGKSPPTRMLLDCARGQRSAYLEADLNLVDVRDVAAGMVQAMEQGQPGRRYLLGAENWSVRRVFEFVARECGGPGPTWAVPYPLALATAYVSEWVASTLTGVMPAASVTGVKLTRRRMQFDASRSWAELGIVPRNVAATLREQLAWFKLVGWLRQDDSKLIK